MGLLPLGAAVMTSPGKLPHRAIIHVAGINLVWVSTEYSIRRSVRSALDLAAKNGMRSIAFPLIGAGTGGGKDQRVMDLMIEEIESCAPAIEVRIVKFAPNAA